MNVTTPRILIIDDQFGRDIPGAPNRDRENLCGKFLLAEERLSTKAMTPRIQILDPIGKAVFCRGQLPKKSNVGSTVENDLRGTMEIVRKGWTVALLKGELPWSMVLLDLCFYTGPVTNESHSRSRGMPEGRHDDDDPRGYFGLVLLDAINREFPDLPVIILSSKPRQEVSLEFSTRGALGFIARDDPRGPELLENALWQHGLLPDPIGEVVGNSLSVLLALREARRAAQHRQNLLIRGERGTGKELLASYANRVSAMSNGIKTRPLVTVNSAVLRNDLFSSELFGIESKTASGVTGNIGLVEAANGGDLFLDEIADMPLDVQAAVLRVLQERCITRVGARQSMPVDVRFLSASNVDLEADPRDFRSDLLDRLRLGGTLWLPPLRERKTDITTLAEKFVREAEAQRSGSLRRQITPEAFERLLQHEWPGNVRELRTCLFDAVNRNPDVEYLVPGHLRITKETSGQSTIHSGSQSSPLVTSHPSIDESPTLKTLLASYNRIRFNTSDITDWSGRLSEIQHTQSWLLARYLQAAIEATKRRTLSNPEGLIQIHPAVKLITGDASLTASKAADIIKRLLGPIEDEIEGNLREAMEIAIRLRPKSGKRAIKRN